MANKVRRSSVTRSYTALSVVSFLISAALVVAPLVVFGFAAITSNVAWYAWVLFASGILLFIVDLIRHAKVRSSVWCILLGLALTIDPTKMLILIAVTTGCVLIDEYVVWPIHRSARAKARINRQFDKRMK